MYIASIVCLLGIYILLTSAQIQTVFISFSLGCLLLTVAILCDALLGLSSTHFHILLTGTCLFDTAAPHNFFTKKEKCTSIIITYDTTTKHHHQQWNVNVSNVMRYVLLCILLSHMCVLLCIYPAKQNFVLLNSIIFLLYLCCLYSWWYFLFFLPCFLVKKATTTMTRRIKGKKLKNWK